MSEAQGKDVEAPVNLQDNEKPSKILRLFTVSAYVFSVSFAAMTLALYYIFFWNPHGPEHSKLEAADNMLGVPENYKLENHL